jgi:bacterioferritin (cytochrome b1)
MQRPSSLILAALLGTLGCSGVSLSETDSTEGTEGTDATEGTDVTQTYPPLPTDVQCDTPLPEGFGQCANPQWLTDGLNNCTGYVRCEDGAINRVVVMPSDPTIPGLACSPQDTGGGDGACAVDADCSGPERARCVERYEPSVGFNYCTCQRSCTTDDQCPSNQVCSPDVLNGGELGASVCVPAGCSTGADCESGECGLGVFSDDCEGHVDLACRSEADDCRVAADYVPGPDEGTAMQYENHACVVGPNGTFVIQFDICDVGRPLRVNGDNRTASTAQGAGWTTTLDATPASTTHAATLADYWAHVGLMEHASVASFNRVSLQLMALGAPADLVRRTQEAALDEVRHAELAFGLATHFSGSPVGPGPMSLAGVTLDTTPEQVLTDLIEEACVRETLGVAEALLAASVCQDPVVYGVLEQIAADELRHAQLAWATLDWMLLMHPRLRSLAKERFDRELDRAASGEFVGDGPALPALGLPGSPARQATHQDVVVNCLRPAVEALFSERRAA